MNGIRNHLLQQQREEQNKQQQQHLQQQPTKTVPTTHSLNLFDTLDDYSTSLTSPIKSFHPSSQPNLYWSNSNSHSQTAWNSDLDNTLTSPTGGLDHSNLFDSPIKFEPTSNNSHQTQESNPHYSSHSRHSSSNHSHAHSYHSSRNSSGHNSESNTSSSHNNYSHNNNNNNNNTGNSQARRKINLGMTSDHKSLPNMENAFYNDVKFELGWPSFSNSNDSHKSSIHSSSEDHETPFTIKDTPVKSTAPTSKMFGSASLFYEEDHDHNFGDHPENQDKNDYDLNELIKNSEPSISNSPIKRTSKIGNFMMTQNINSIDSGLMRSDMDSRNSLNSNSRFSGFNLNQAHHHASHVTQSPPGLSSKHRNSNFQNTNHKFGSSSLFDDYEYEDTGFDDQGSSLFTRFKIGSDSEN